MASDPLVQRALDGLMALLPKGYAAYFELRDGQWWYEQARAGEYGHADVAAAVAAGLPFETTPHLRQPWDTAQPHYQSLDDIGKDELASTATHVQATAGLPVCASGQVLGVIGCGLFAGRTWSAEHRAAVVQSLGLAIEGP